MHQQRVTTPWVVVAIAAAAFLVEMAVRTRYGYHRDGRTTTPRSMTRMASLAHGRLSVALSHIEGYSGPPAGSENAGRQPKPHRGRGLPGEIGRYLLPLGLAADGLRGDRRSIPPAA